MGSGFSSFFEENNSNGAPTTTSRTAGLGELPENCLAIILECLEPSEICKLALVNRTFYQASSADCVWESKLPDNYRLLANKVMLHENYSSKKDIYARLCCPNRFSSGTKEAWMEKKLGGGLCVSVSWKGMKITGIDDRRYWSHISTPQSRFHTVAYLHQVWWLEVEGELELEFPAGNYSLFFRIQLGRPSSKGLSLSRQSSSSITHQQVHGWSMKPVRFQFSLSNGQHAMSECFLNEQRKWLHYHVGDFITEDSYNPTKIKFSMTQIDCTHQKGGLALDSVFVCPAEMGRKIDKLNKT